jgi:plastocyanin
LRARCIGGHCGDEPLPLGAEVAEQTAGDCQLAVCDGDGDTTSQDDDDDVADDGNDCTVDACEDGEPSHDPATAGVVCDDNGGSFCNATSACVECGIGDNCASGVCQDDMCRETDCDNDMTDVGETDEDCGGTECGPCGPGLMCIEDSDCAGNDCTSDLCVANCDDGVMNNTEIAVDCGPGCDTCPIDSACGNDDHCTSDFCHPTTDTCEAPTCNDGFMNGTETGEDCGGGCDPCPVTCDSDDDCTVTGICYRDECVASLNGCTPASSMSRTGMAAVTIQFGGGLGSVYSPRCIVVDAGTDITFDGTFSGHPLAGGIVTGGAKDPQGSGPFFPTTSSGTTKLVADLALGSYPFYCDVHGPGGMTGVVFVRP